VTRYLLYSLALIVWSALFFVACDSTGDALPVNEGTTAVDSAQQDSARRGAPRQSAHDIDTTTFSVTDSTVTLKQQAYPKPSGRVINVVVTGLDSRLGDPMGHADANHVLRFFLDSGMIEVISIPRDTEYDAGFDDTTGLNRLTNVRANRGRNAYHRAIQEIAGISKVDFYIEFGFSQAIGLLELVGYRDNASATLRVLRSRQAYRSGDFQRSYNQGQFIRQIMLKHFEKTEGLFGDLALRAALALVDTDLTYAKCSEIIDALRASGFGNNQAKSWVRLKPAVIARFTVYDFDAANVDGINQTIDKRIKRIGGDSITINEQTYEAKLSRLLQKASADSVKSPTGVIRLLRRSYEQRAWLQISDRQKRRVYRDRLCGLLVSAYDRTKQPKTAESIRQFMMLDGQVFTDPN